MTSLAAGKYKETFMGFTQMLKITGLFVLWGAIVAVTWLASTPQTAATNAGSQPEVAAAAPAVNSMEHPAVPPSTGAPAEKQATTK